MKTYTFTFHDCFLALRHQIKRFILIIVVFACIGIAAGLFYAQRLSALSTYHVDLLEPVDLSVGSDYDLFYYSACATSLKQSYSNLQTYISVFSEESTLTSAQQEKLNGFLLSLEEWNTVELNPISTAIDMVDRIYVPQSLIDDLTAYYSRNLAAVNSDLIVSQEAVETIRSMTPPDLANSKVADVYLQLISQARQHGYNLQKQAQYSTYLDLLQNHRAKVLSDSRRVARLESLAAASINLLIEEVNAYIKQVAEENLLNVSIQYDNRIISVAVTHSYRDSVPEENFMLIFFLTLLSGICFAAFFSIYFEVAKKNDQLDSTTEMCPDSLYEEEENSDGQS